jgi:hypothetical protein
MVVADDVPTIREPERNIRDRVGAVWRKEQDHAHRAVHILPYVILGRGRLYTHCRMRVERNVCGLVVYSERYRLVPSVSWVE